MTEIVAEVRERWERAADAMDRAGLGDGWAWSSARTNASVCPTTMWGGSSAGTRASRSRTRVP